MRSVPLSPSATLRINSAKGLTVRFFAALRMTIPNGCIVKCTNVVCFDLEWPRVLTLRQRLFDFRQHLDPLPPRAQWIPKKSVDIPRTGQRPVPPTKTARQAGSAAILAAHARQQCQRTFYNLQRSSAWLPGVSGE